MYLDLFAFDRASTSYVSRDIENFREILHWTGDHFIMKKTVPHGKLRQEKKRSIGGVLRLAEYFRKGLINLSIYPSLDDRIELKLSDDLKHNNSPREQSEKTSVAVAGYKPPITIHDLVPSGFFYRLHETYQSIINGFVTRVNESGISVERTSAVMSSKWFRNPQINRDSFSLFWDRLYTDLTGETEITRERVNAIWKEAESGKNATIERVTLEQRLQESPIVNTPTKTDAELVDGKHPDYVKERGEIIQLLDQGRSSQEIRRLKPHVKPQAISGITAWYRHRDSWNGK